MAKYVKTKGTLVKITYIVTFVDSSEDKKVDYIVARNIQDGINIFKSHFQECRPREVSHVLSAECVDSDVKIREDLINPDQTHEY